MRLMKGVRKLLENMAQIVETVELEKLPAWGLCAHGTNIDSLASSVGYGLRGLTRCRDEASRRYDRCRRDLGT